MPTSLPLRDLRADCSRCAGLCCVVPALVRSADFALDKPAGQPCPHLAEDFGCDVHDRLRPLGFPGCTVYDCFGAGQRVVQDTFGGADWRARPDLAERQFRVFAVVRDLHELLWYLRCDLRLVSLPSYVDHAGVLAPDLARVLEETERLAGLDAAALEHLDVGPHRAEVDALLRATSAAVRASCRPDPPDLTRADLVGRRLRRADLRAADLRGALLVGADLRGADLTVADLVGADLRAARVGGADLSTALHLTRFQVAAAAGDASTLLPEPLDRPPHWR